jgi:hypothetical protein
MASFVTARVQDQFVFGIRCPIEGCKNELHEQDIQKLVQASVLSQEVADQMAKLRKQDYTVRLEQFCDDMDSMTKLGGMRLCPRCCVIIQKSAGCNSFGCICGHRFSWDQALCLENIERLVTSSFTEETSKHFTSVQDATRHILKACVIKGIKKYHRVVKFAEERGLSIDMAEVHEQALLGQQAAIEQLGDARRSRKNDKMHSLLATQLHISLDEAQAILEDAQAGNEAAWQKIREARSLRSLQQEQHATPSQSASDMSNGRCLQNESKDSCVNSTSPSENLLNDDLVSPRAPEFFTNISANVGFAFHGSSE